MSRVITLRTWLVAAGALAAVALTGCDAPATVGAPAPGPQRLQLDLPHHPDPAPVELTGTDAGLITQPATIDGAH